MIASTPRYPNYEMTSTEAQDKVNMEEAAEIPLIDEETICRNCKKLKRKERVIQTLIVLNIGIFLLSVVLALSVFRAYDFRDRDHDATNITWPDSVYCK